MQAATRLELDSLGIRQTQGEGGGSSLDEWACVRENCLAGDPVGKPGDRKGHLPYNCFAPSLDSDQKDQLIEVIEKLLADKTTVSALWEDRTEAGSSSSALPIHNLLPCFPSWWRAV